MCSDGQRRVVSSPSPGKLRIRRGTWNQCDRPLVGILAAWGMIQLVLVAPGAATVPLHFPGQVTVPLQDTVTAVATYDFDGAGMAEVVAGLSGGFLTVIQSVGNGNFRATQYQEIGGEIVALKVFTPGPGPEDLLVVLTANPDRLLVMTMQNDVPPFTLQASVDLYEDPRSMVGGPLVSDGGFGLAVNLPGADRWVLISPTESGWQVSQEISSGDRPYDIELIDLEGDGVPEVLTADNGVLSKKVSLYARDLTGSYAMSGQMDTPGDVVDLYTFREDSQEKLIVCYADSSYLSVYIPVAGALQETERILTAAPADGAIVGTLDSGDPGLWCWDAERGIIHYFVKQTSDWLPIESYYAGGPALDLLLTDINRDFFVDLAVANGDAHSVALLFANDLPSFRAYLATIVSASPNDGIVIDEDQDGHLDYLVASIGGSAVEFLRGDGFGHLVRDAQVLALNNTPRTLTSVHANQDTLPDLAVVSSSNSRVQIWLRQPDGTYQAGGSITTGTGPFRALSADFDADGFEDLIIGSEISDDLTLAFGTGDGNFPDVSVIPLPNDLTELTYLSLDPDNLPDLLLTNGQGAISTMLNLGDRVFGQLRFYSIGILPIGMVTADLDGDGDEDVVVAKQGDDSLALLENLGDGNLSLRVRNHDLEGTPGHVVMDDMDLSGTQDVVVTYPEDQTIGIILNAGNFILGPPIKFVSALQPVALSRGDFNEDGIPDLITLDRALQITLTMLNVEPNPIPIQQPRLTANCQAAGIELAFTRPATAAWVLEGESRSTWRLLASADGALFGDLQLQAEQGILSLTAADLSKADLTSGSDDALAFRLVREGGEVMAHTTVDVACWLAETGYPEPSLRLASLHPNPFNPAVTAHFSLARASRVRAVVRDLAGNQVAVLVDRLYAAGTHVLSWDGRSRGRTVSAGTYLLTVTAGNTTVSRKMTLLK